METLDLHLSEDDLEAYAFERTDDYLTDAIEDHLLLCPPCRVKLDRLEGDIVWMRIAFKYSPR